MSNNDWNGNYHSIYVTLGASNHTDKEREQNDYYATEPRAVELLLDKETFSPLIWEPACGEGHIAKVLEERGHDVISTDLIDRGYGKVLDFLKVRQKDLYCNPDNINLAFDIITNPPYKFATEFVEQALRLVRNGSKVAMFLKLTFLEGKNRRKLFELTPPRPYMLRVVGCYVL
ncbi:MAG: class I SAM-dependent methyltransferase [Clostridium sp.]|nr:class I SAM-dependent methyltransferase [Clostridium sp.]